MVDVKVGLGFKGIGNGREYKRYIAIVGRCVHFEMSVVVFVEYLVTKVCPVLTPAVWLPFSSLLYIFELVYAYCLIVVYLTTAIAAVFDEKVGGIGKP